MTKRLRIKLIITIICIVAILLGLAFISLLHFTSRSLRLETDEMLDAVIHGREPEPQSYNERRAFGIVVVDAEGEANVVGGNLLQTMDEETIKDMAYDIIEANCFEGSISKCNLRYRRLEKSRVNTIVLLDTTQEQKAREVLINNCLFIGLAALIAFSALAVMLSDWLLKPVEAAWKRSKSFISDASHELKTPLTVVISNSEMLSYRIDKRDKKSIRWCAAIHAEALRMKALVEDMLELAKLDESSGEKIVAEDVDLEYTLTDVVLTMEAHAFEQGKEIRLDVSPGVIVRGDAELLRRMCVILVDNAIKYSSEGGVIDVKLTENGFALIEVSNPGEELSSDEAEKIFYRFYRTDKARTYNGGHGLGLPILTNIVYMHNGNVEVKSKNGINTFSVSLPIK